MPRYYFDLYDCISVRDDNGVELPDLDAVRAEAHRALAELAANHPADEGSVQICTEVRDGDGNRVLSATLLILSKLHTRVMSDP
jgi:hypothetical protein